MTSRTSPRPPRTLVLGLGNAILGDDAVGLRVAALVGERLGPESSVEVDEESHGGLRLMERLSGYDGAVLVDALVSGRYRPGAVVHLGPGDVPTQHVSSSHDVNLQTALRLAEAMGIPVPRSVRIVGVEALEVEEFSDVLTPAVEAALPEAAQAVLLELAALGAELPERASAGPDTAGLVKEYS